ncbi:MAG: cytochrome C551 [Gemmatimonadetes bacterium]|jgi:CDGSH-type Zn-finger protein|nr:cytochrome C551 [Gemmatimonadota bacterium]
MPYAKHPWIGLLEEGTHAFCACGETGKAPFCDGNHARTGKAQGPVIASAPARENHAVCMCGATANSPWCDGAHKNLP